jgi:tripartite-type tricarboxylate transporter receptor subunit TctC
MNKNLSAMNAVRCAALSLTALMAASGALQAQTWPVKPVSIVVPFAPGGSSDIDARFDANLLGQALGQPFVLDYRTGAASTIGTAFTARAAPDGYTIHFISAGFAAQPALYKNLSYDAVRDFAPLSLMSESPNLFVVHPSSPFKSMQDVITYARSHPGELNFGTSGVGAFSHIVGEWFSDVTKTKMTFVPYKGLGPSLLAVAAGEIHWTASSVVSSMPLVKSGRLRAIAVSTGKRLTVMPDLPSVTETVKGYEWNQWNGYVAPAKTPAPIVSRLNAELVKVAKSPENVKRLSAAGSLPVGSTPEEFRSVIVTEAARWAKLLKQIGLQLEE